MTTTTAPSQALDPPPEAIVISHYNVLLGDILEATKAAADVAFDYRSKEGNKAARSYIFQQRKLRARIEAARKDAKSYALAYGKAVDAQARDLLEQVDALIEPHQRQIDAIAQAEAERVAAHKAVIDTIRDLARVPFGAAAAEIAATLAELKATGIDGLEEFRDEAAAALLGAIRALEDAHAKAAADEAAAAELARLQQEAAERAEREAAAERERQAADAQARAAEEAQAQADAAAVAQIEEAERRAAEAEARARAAEARAAAAPPPAPAPTAPAAAPMGEAVASNKAEKLHRELLEALAGLNRLGVADALVAGTLHSAVTIDWRGV